MTEWAGFLPGFDKTVHDVSNILISVNGNTAIATADIVADHYVDDLQWQLTGDYVYKLEKQNGIWKITSHTLNFISETGTRGVLPIAATKASENPVEYLK
tara:strand:+ start:3484 stop:3783 length:300 start_codon:yes stop_codon:yes gene_type:complete